MIEIGTIPEVDYIIPEVDQCFPNLRAVLIILATMDLVTCLAEELVLITKVHLENR